MRLVSLYCDGSALPRLASPGGWAWVAVRDDEVLAEASGSVRKTNNNEMELRAVAEALRAAVDAGWHKRFALELVTDSRTALDVARGEDVPRRLETLSAEVRALVVKSGVGLRWVRGHAGETWNEHVDALAAKARLAVTKR